MQQSLLSNPSCWSVKLLVHVANPEEWGHGDRPGKLFK
jgi:hypothetical protein